MVQEEGKRTYINNTGAELARYRGVVQDASYANSVKYPAGAGADGFKGVVIYDLIADGKAGAIQTSGKARITTVTGTAIAVGDYLKFGDAEGRATKANQTTPSDTYVIGRAETATTGGAGETVDFDIRPEYRSI